MDQLSLLELIDDIERLGLGYLFEEEIKKAMDTIVSMEDMQTRTEESFHATALLFRLLRQHGYKVHQGMFNHLKDETGNFKASYDAKGILSLYEASHFAVEGESILEEAKDFTVKALKEIKGSIEPNLAKQVNHALEIPLHWRVPRVEARWYIDIYEKKKNSTAALIELAKLDFNIVQAIHQEDVAELSRWWKTLGLGEEMSFARDSLIQNYLWTMGWNPEPQFSNFRIENAKVCILVTVIDDMYDVYGSVEELELFTDAVERWDLKAMEQLPDYMKICFLALFNSVNEMGYFHLKEHGIDNIPFLKKAWVVQLKAYLLEAKWYHNNHKTTFEEYLNNAMTTVGNNLLFTHAFFSLGQTLREDMLDCASQYPSLFHWTSMIVRLANDFGTSRAELERGDVLKSMQSYMQQTGASEDVARKHIKNMISETWKKVNNDLYTNGFLLPQPFIMTMINHARMSICMYQYGDGHAELDDESVHRANSMLFEPIPLLKDA
ncbi:alpha-terpineol synthase, chloroplastic-like [Macadamia integrifolia]|uniref:alpha-terpineol synthase, chloroplastic-like n=1 Tax=Macadamia integrifolia TaxID=60698 RepID=UPI001C4E4D73|nr:alpha-terpineol synthase, chloroplastic-like [Macadamia integrifolia]